MKGQQKKIMQDILRNGKEHEYLINRINNLEERKRYAKQIRQGVLYEDKN